MKTTVYHPTLPATQEVADTDVESWLEQGWLTTQPGAVAEAAAYDPATATVKAVLAHVGKDAALAAEALAFERAKGDEARPSLVEKLEKLANPASDNLEGVN